MLIRKQRRIDRINDRFAGINLFVSGTAEDQSLRTTQEHLLQIQAELKRWPKLWQKLSFNSQELGRLQRKLSRLHQLETRFDGGVAALNQPQTVLQLDLAIEAMTKLWDELNGSDQLPGLSFTIKNVGFLLTELKRDRQNLLAMQNEQQAAKAPSGVPKDVLLNSAFSIPEPD